MIVISILVMVEGTALVFITTVAVDEDIATERVLVVFWPRSTISALEPGGKGWK